ncbi:MAG: TolC family protein [Saprospiraceae bacterium]|nr:TolC family protein [Saprospiraceae bacterium]
MIIYPRIILIFIILMLSSMSKSQELLNLEQCIKIAQEKSITIKQAMISERESIINEKLAKRQLLPSLEGNSNLSYNIGRRVSPLTNTYISESFLSQSYSLSTGMVVYNGNRLKNNINKAKFDMKVAEENTNQIERDIALLVTNYYLLILYADENLNNAVSQYTSTKEQLEKTKKLVSAGSKPASATLNLEAQSLSDEQKMIMRQNDLEKAYLDLKNVLQLNENTNIKVQVPDIEAMLIRKDFQYSLSELILKSLQHQPELSAAEYKIKSAEITKKLALAGLMPSLSFFGGVSSDFVNKAKEVVDYNTVYSYTNFLINNQEINVGVPYEVPVLQNQKYFDQLNNNLGLGFAVQLRIPIYDNYSSKSNIQKAKLGIEAAKLQKDQAIQDIKSKVQVALADYKAAKMQYQASEKAYSAQKNAFESTKTQFDIGLVSIYDFMNAKTLFDQAENTLLISKYDFVFKTKILDFYLGENLTF